VGLRVKLRINPPEIAALPWEFLYDAGEEEYLCLERSSALVRYLELPRAGETPSDQDPATGRRLGLLQPALYDSLLPGSGAPRFRDITMGTNGVFAAGSGLGRLHRPGRARRDCPAGLAGTARTGTALTPR
jgi:hypothetical protein